MAVPASSPLLLMSAGTISCNHLCYVTCPVETYHHHRPDLTSAFYQILLAKESMKYCGVATPFKGVRVYIHSTMGMPCLETTLEEVRPITTRWICGQNR